MEYDSLLFEGDLRYLITSEIRYGDAPNILDVLDTVEDVVMGILDDEPTKQEFLERYQNYNFEALLEKQTKHMDLEDYAEVFAEHFSVCVTLVPTVTLLRLAAHTG